jgi:hypothetical protein
MTDINGDSGTIFWLGHSYFRQLDNAPFHRAHFDTARLIMMADAVAADGGIDHKQHVPLGNGLHRALRAAEIAGDTRIGDRVGDG